MAAPFKKVLLVDFESRYSTKPQWWTAEPFSLRNMTTEEYLRDKRFADFGAVIQPFENDAPVSQWYDGGVELRRVLRTYDWGTTAVVAHNAIFDAGILQWHYGIRPAFIFDTLSMSRALRGPRGGNGLADLAREFQLPAKGAELALTDGLHTLTPEVKEPLIKYCRHDVWLLKQVFKRLLAKCATFEEAVGVDWDCADHYQPQHWVYPIKELRIIDMTVRMFTEPQLELDTEMLQEALEEERVSRETLLGRLRITDADLASNDRFAEILRSIGVEPPTKKKRPTAKTPNPVGFNYAFAKTDAMFQAMINGDDDNLSTLCEARLKVKSTTERTRAQRFLDIAGRGSLPVPVFYYGAQTGRFAAAKGQAINMQNLKRGSFLRKAIMAPKDHLLVVGDLSQIEPRVLGWLSDYEALLGIFRSGQDAYAMFGAQMFNEPGLSKESHPDLRQSAKSALLGCGYQLGWASFAAQLLVGFLGAPPVRYDKDFARKLGVNRHYLEEFLDYEENRVKMGEIARICTDEELIIHCVSAKKIIDIYRSTAEPVTEFWKLCQDRIVASLVEGEEYRHKCLLFRKGEIVLPNGMSLLYPDLRQQKDEQGRKQWVYGRDATKLYAGKVTNNVTQALARIVMTDGMLRVNKRYPTKGTVHDELIALAHKSEAQDALPWVLEQMTIEPAYMPGIPLAADGGVHRRYGLAKN